MTERKYVTAKFDKGPRAYTYHCDIEGIGPGDIVKVDGRHGIQKVTIVEIDLPKPEFETKGIIERVPSEPRLSGH